MFKVLWVEPANVFENPSTAIITGPNLTNGMYGQQAYWEIRRFIVIQEGHGNCICIPMHTYRGQGTLKRGVRPQDHAVIFAQGETAYTAPGEKIQIEPFCVKVEVEGEKLDPMTRINFSKLYTVEHNNKVANIGIIVKADIQRLLLKSPLKILDKGKDGFADSESPNESLLSG